MLRWLGLTSRREPLVWYFHTINVRRIDCAQRLSRDLWVNRVDAALAVELLDEIKQLRTRCVLGKLAGTFLAK